MSENQMNLVATVVHNMRSSMERDIEILRRDLRSRLAGLDKTILQKEAEYETLVADSVSNDEAVAAIVESLRAGVRKMVGELNKRALGACGLGAHRSTRRYSWNSEQGGVESKREASGLKMLYGGYNESPLVDLIGALWSDEAGERFARAALQGRTAPKHGLTVDQLHAKAEKLADEIKALYDERWGVQQKVGGFIDVGGLNDAEPTWSPAGPDSRDPTVQVMGADGGLQDTVIGHSLQDSIGIAEERRAVEARRAAAESRAAAEADAAREQQRLDDLVRG